MIAGSPSRCSARSRSRASTSRPAGSRSVRATTARSPARCPASQCVRESASVSCVRRTNRWRACSPTWWRHDATFDQRGCRRDDAMNMTIAGLTLRSLLGRRRVGLVVRLPVILIGLPLVGHFRRPDGTEWIGPIMQAVGFGVVVPVMALVIGASVLGSEIDDGTIVHILTKPLPRREILFAKLAVAASVTAVVTGITMFIAGLIALDVRFGVGMAVGAVVASICYSALFVAISLVSRRPVLVGLLYVLLW